MVKYIATPQQIYVFAVVDETRLKNWQNSCPMVRGISIRVNDNNEPMKGSIKSCAFCKHHCANVLEGFKQLMSGR